MGLHKQRFLCGKRHRRHFTLYGATGDTVQYHQILRLPRNKTENFVENGWNVICIISGATGITIQDHQQTAVACHEKSRSTISKKFFGERLKIAQSNRIHPAASPNSAPATRNNIPK